MKIIKLEKVIDSCTSNKQLIVATIYAEIFLKKFIKYHELTVREENLFLVHIGSALTNKSKEVCGILEAIRFNINLSDKGKARRYFHVLESYLHIPTEDRIKKEEYL